MNRTSILLPLLLIGVAGSLSCSSEGKNPVVPARDEASHLMIQVEKSGYTVEEVGFGGPGFFATLNNPTARTFYATLGDRTNSAPEQEMLWVVEGSDAFIEKRTRLFSWANSERTFNHEGVGPIELRPHGQYRMFGYVLGSDVPGTYRLRVQYYGDPAMSASSMLEDVSRTFTVR